MAVVYLAITIFIFKSFVKKDFNFYVSLNLFFGFFLVFITFFSNLIMIIFNINSYPISAGIISLDIAGMFLIFSATTRIRSVIEENPNLIRRKILNVLFLSVMSTVIFMFSYNYASIETIMITPILFQKNILNVQYMITLIVLLTLMFFHIPKFKEYFYIRIGIFSMILRLFSNIINIYIPQDLEMYSSILGILSLITWGIAFYNLYKAKRPPFKG